MMGSQSQVPRYMLNLDSVEETESFKNHVEVNIKGNKTLTDFLAENCDGKNENINEVNKAIVDVFEKAAKSSQLMTREDYKNREESEVIDEAVCRYLKKRVDSDKERGVPTAANITATKEYGDLLKQLQLVQRNNEKEYNVTSEKFLAHFKRLYSIDDGDEQGKACVESSTGPELVVDKLGGEISCAEIYEAIDHLEQRQTNVSSGLDGVSNEYLICTRKVQNLVPIYQKLFNHVLDKGDMPASWCLGKIHPIFKGSGDLGDPKNYRGVVQFSCLGKLFTQILKVHLTVFLNQEVIDENQASCREGYDANDHVFVLKSLVDIYLSKGKDLLCVFVDFEKAFDSVPRENMLAKLAGANVGEKVFNVISKFYDRTEYSYGGNVSESFRSSKGLPQGDRLSPILFNLYVNDMKDYLISCGCTPIKVVPGEASSGDMLLLQYADDTIILADKIEDLQKAVKTLQTYCEKWDLKINETKTEFVPFTKNLIRKFQYKYYTGIQYNNGELMKSGNQFKYLGVKFQTGGSLQKCISYIVDESKQVKSTRFTLKLMAEQRTKYSQDPSRKQYIEEFIKGLIYETMLRKSEIWGYECFDSQIYILENSCRKLLVMAGIDKLDLMTYIKNLKIECKKKAVKFLERVSVHEEKRYTKVIYRDLKQLCDSEKFDSPWFEYAHT